MRLSEDSETGDGTNQRGGRERQVSARSQRPERPCGRWEANCAAASPPVAHGRPSRATEAAALTGAGKWAAPSAVVGSWPARCISVHPRGREGGPGSRAAGVGGPGGHSPGPGAQFRGHAQLLGKPVRAAPSSADDADFEEQLRARGTRGQADGCPTQLCASFS